MEWIPARVPLGRAVLCGDCDEIYAFDKYARCPACDSGSSLNLAGVLLRQQGDQGLWDALEFKRKGLSEVDARKWPLHGVWEEALERKRLVRSSPPPALSLLRRPPCSLVPLVSQPVPREQEEL